MKLPRVTVVAHRSGRVLRVRFTTHGGSDVATALRLRAYHGGHLVANRAVVVRNHHARLRLTARHAGRYRMVVSIDAGGRVGKLTRVIHVG